MTKAKSNRAVCRSCNTRYDTSSLSAGTPFSCRHCGEVVYVPGERQPDQLGEGVLPFGQMAVKMGFITTEQLRVALKEQLASEIKTRRVGDILIEKGFLNDRQVSKILHGQGAKIAHLIPGYEIVEKLGEGGMGAVYKGVHLASRKTVAIKNLTPRLAKRMEFLKRFHREARVAIDMDHPNIVKGFDEGSCGNHHYFVMEYVFGKSAARVLKKRGKFGEKRAFFIMRQVAKGLEYAYARSIVHRDIKPDNIMIAKDGRVKLADYGLVKFTDDMGEGSLTLDGQVMGTPNYISPEQATGASTVDIRSDIYSLGASLFHLVTGRPPFSGSSSAVIMGLHVSAPTPDPQEANPALSEGARDIIMRMMAKDPANRFQTPHELLVATSKYFKGKPTGESPLTPSDEKKALATPWSMISGAGGEDEKEALLEGAEEVGFSQSRTTQLLFGAGVLALVVGLTAAAIYFWEKPGGTAPQPPPPTTNITSAKEQLKKALLLPEVKREKALRQLIRDFPNSPEADRAAQLLAQALLPAPVSPDELQAADLYKQALTAAGKEREKILRSLVRRFPKTNTTRLAQQELARIDRRRREQVRIARKIAAEKREQESLRAFNKVMRQTRDSPSKFVQALRQVMKAYPNTGGARRAGIQLRELLARRKREKEIREEQRRREKEERRLAAERELEKRIGPPRRKFLDSYRSAFIAFDLKAAAGHAQRLAANKNVPELRQLARDCLADIADLEYFFPALRAGLEAAGDGLETLTFRTSKEPLSVRILEVRGSEIRMRINNSVPYSRQITALSDKDLDRFFRKGRQGKTTPAAVVIGLYHLGCGRLKTAAKYFDQAGGKDPRRQHHRKLLQWWQ